MDDYVYLGVTFYYNNTFTKAIERQILLARKALFSLDFKIKTLNLNVDMQIDLFKKLIVPILTYGCEIWGYNTLETVELFQRKFLKNTLKLHKYTANPIVYGETGTEPLRICIYNRMINFWHRTRVGDTNKISSILYKLVKTYYDNDIYKTKWALKINNILDSMGRSYLWNFDRINTKQIKEMTKRKLKDIYLQEWNTEINENRLCINYKL